MMKERFCKICGDKLSRYNKSDTCFRHTKTSEALVNLEVEKENNVSDRSQKIDLYIKHYWKL